MKEKKWKLIFKLGNIPFAVTILIAMVVTVLGFLGKVGINWVSSAILLVLISIAYQLLSSYDLMSKLENQIQSPSIGNIFRPYDERMMREIRNRIDRADEIWLLSRTGMGFLRRDYRKEFEKFIKKGKARFLFLNPENGALKMVEECQETELDRDEVILRHRKIYREFLNSWKAKTNNGDSDLRVIGHLPPWTLIFFDPQKKGGKTTVYVELATYRPTPRERPVFEVTGEDEYFDIILDDFNQMWNDAESWPLGKNNE